MNKKKTKSELLSEFKRANRDRREKLAIREGYKTSAEYLAYLEGKKTTTKKSTTKTKFKEDECLDVVIAFDTTGSMSSYISSVRKHAKEVVTDLFKNTPNLKMKIVAFGDYCDMASSTKFGIAYQESKLTNDVDSLINFIDTAKNTNGGDSDEFYELVIKKITEETPWRKGKKSVLLIADSNPHEVGYSYSGKIENAQIDWRKEAKKSANLGIQWDTLKIIPSYTWYNELSQITGGLSLDFRNSNKISDIMVGTTYARAASYSEGATMSFMSTMDAVEASGDSELIGAYKKIKTLI